MWSNSCILLLSQLFFITDAFAENSQLCLFYISRVRFWKLCPGDELPRVFLCVGCYHRLRRAERKNVACVRVAVRAVRRGVGRRAGGAGRLAGGCVVRRGAARAGACRSSVEAPPRSLDGSLAPAPIACAARARCERDLSRSPPLIKASLQRRWFLSLNDSSDSSRGPHSHLPQRLLKFCTG